VRDGDGWTECTLGHRHWGRFGAAGLLAVTERTAPGGTAYVLMQHRAAWSHGGDTWGVPGGARGSTETALAAAQRETVEETGIDVAQVVPVAEHVADHGSWSYTTIVGTVPERLPVVPDRESIALRWVAVDEVTDLPLLPAFAAAWPALLRLLP
jgi:8-oxo-dGTP pyrophosphatase MutT (NUDIX family)